MVQVEGKQRLVFECPSRGLIGFRAIFATLTRGSGIMHRAFSAYGPYRCANFLAVRPYTEEIWMLCGDEADEGAVCRGPLDQVRKGVLISTTGPAFPQ